MQLRIENEYDTLEAVLVHRPGPEVDRLTLDNMRRFLFGDIPFLRRMRDEHDAFVETMRNNGIIVFYLRDLLLDVMNETAPREVLIQQTCATDMVPAITDDLASMKYWDADALTTILFAGLTAEEYRNATGKRARAALTDDEFLISPVPNAYFTRDPAVVVRDAAISSKMHYRQRVRESLNTRIVLEHHPEFRDNAITYGGTDEPTEDRPYTIEGGDVIVLSPEAVLIGDSERTRSETIELLATNCFRVGNVQRVYEVAIPRQQAFMHLDTVMTIVDRGVATWFGDVMDNVPFIHRYEPDENGNAHRVQERRSLPDILRDEFQTDLTIIPTAGGTTHFASREQRADGTNTLAIAPRVAITYERNERTNAALADHGVKCIDIDDAELVRGLGGPRCMTMPLRRVPPS